MRRWVKTWRAGFWCAIAERDVEVEFTARGIPGLRGPGAVERCSAFDPPTAISCSRRCLDATFRRQWQPDLPVRTRLDDVA